MRKAVVVSGMAAFTILEGLAPSAGQPGASTAAAARSHLAQSRPLSSPLYGVTVDDVSHLPQIVAGLRHLSQRPITRIYFDVKESPGYYAPAVKALRPVSYLMGELLDSSDERHISTAAYHRQVKSYLATFGRAIDLWEIGNEVNGNWTGPYRTVRTKLAAGYSAVAADRKRTALTLYYNIGCGDGPSELDPIKFSTEYVPASVRRGLNYVLLSYYEQDCRGIRPGPSAWSEYFAKLHVLYPHARLGFGEIGLRGPVDRATLTYAEGMIRYYYDLRLRLPYYVGGYFWWYYKEDCLPYTSKPLWRVLRKGFAAETAVWHRAAGLSRGVRMR